MQKYQFDNLSYKNDLESIKIPKFQRGLVWNKDKKISLLNTIHNGFPFGALLVSDESTDRYKKLLLLDGQQRLATIKEYEQNKFQYWKKLNKEKYLLLINNINYLIGEKQFFVNDKKLDELAQDSYDLGTWTDDLNFLDKNTKERLRHMVKDARKSANDYIDLDTLLIPVIRYTGSKDYLPEVFENLNRGGVPLTKYEVFNASWDEVYIELPENDFANEILDSVKRYYLNLQDNGEFEISEFSEDELSSSRKINLAEFARAFGEFTVTRLYSLFSKMDNNSFCEIGYGLLAVITRIPNTRIISIQDRVEWIQKNIVDILERTNSLSKNLNNIFSKILVQNLSYSRKRTSKKHAYSTGLTSSFKILSYFADLWDATSDDKKEILKNIPAYYIFDSLNQTWTGHGDARLNDYYPGKHRRSYKNSIDKEAFLRVFDTWIDENPRNRKTFSREIKALITIHANLTYMSASIPNGEDYEFEHIIPKEWIVDKHNTSQPTHLSSLGNGMFLPKSTNNKKKNHTLYEYNQYSDDKFSDFIDESLYPSPADFGNIQRYINLKDYDSINDFIDNRARAVKKSIVDKFYK